MACSDLCLCISLHYLSGKMHHFLKPASGWKQSVLNIILWTYILITWFLEKKIVVYDVCTLILATTFTWKLSLFKKNSVRYYSKFTSDFKYNVQYFCPVVTKHELSWETSIEIPNTKFHKNASSGSQVISCGLTR